MQRSPKASRRPTLGRTSPDKVDLIGGQLRVRTRQLQTLATRLCDQHSVERIRMVKRKRRGRLGMGPCDRQRPATRIGCDPEQFFGHVELANRALDADLPHARGRKIHLASGNGLRLRCSQPRIVQNRPKQNMGVNQQAHSIGGGSREHIGDLVIAFENVVGKREGAFHRADQRSAPWALCRHDPRDRAAIARQFDRFAGFRAADQLGKLGLGFGDGNLQGHDSDLMTNI